MKHFRMLRRSQPPWGMCLILSIGVTMAARAQSTGYELSERDFLSEIPHVYSASRLPQQLEDAAGALTVLDREFIRLTGARDLTEVFRWVPGFQVATSAGGRPVVAYHGLSGQISQRMQVYVDGRSVYAPYLFGGIDWSALSVPLDEIEHIEIQRGSNSVTYGANAFLGVIHIVTRSAAQSVGVRAEVVQGSAGVADRHIRWGHAQPAAQWRIAAGQRSDDGLSGRPDSYRTDYLDLRAEFQPSSSQEWSITSGITRGHLGTGFEARAGDPERTEVAESASFQARYRQTVDPGQEWSLTLSSTHDSGDDSFEIPLLDSDPLRIDGRRQANRYALDYQHFKDFSSQWRASWGLGYRQERVTSSQLFNTSSPQTNTSSSAFLNAEWKPSAHWTLNLGSLIERDSYAPAQWAPRLAINWKPTSQHTLKLGYSSAFRTPSLFEQRADWRIVSEGKTLDIRYLSSGGLLPEKVNVWDLVYLGQWHEQGLTLDARLFQEKLSRIITGRLVLLPSVATDIPNATAYDLRNNASATNRGIEYQLSWRPARGTIVSWNQYFARPQASPDVIAETIARRSTGLLVSHAWSNGWSTGLSYSSVSPVRWLGETTQAGSQRFASLRVARSFRFNDSSMNVAVRWRQPLGQSDEFRELQRELRKVWVSVSVEY
ncbi:TonB-dependent siderophore receptor [Acidovorax sp. T1m]|uniref:TonB-dependent receptor plug domain-containing protein n=2 Tax=unclassified Acidovorax TaxID=2684926 RepID=UPI000B405D55|nr:TonB-dependent receptor [Acidovorax sp. T1m]